MAQPPVLPSLAELANRMDVLHSVEVLLRQLPLQLATQFRQLPSLWYRSDRHQPQFDGLYITCSPSTLITATGFSYWDRRTHKWGYTFSDWHTARRNEGSTHVAAPASLQTRFFIGLGADPFNPAAFRHKSKLKVSS